MENYNPLRTKAVVCLLISDMCIACFDWVWEMDVVIIIRDDDGRLMAVLVLLFARIWKMDGADLRIECGVFL